MNDKRFIYDDRVAEAARLAKRTERLDELVEALKILNIADYIRLGKAEIWIIKQAVSAVYRTLKKFPMLRGEINYFGTLTGYINSKEAIFLANNKSFDAKYLPEFRSTTDKTAERIRQMFLNGNALSVAARYSCGAWSFNAIVINGNFIREQDIAEQLSYNESTGFHPKGCGSVKSLIDHELGHIIDYVCGVSMSKEFTDFLARYTLSDISDKLSTYSASSGNAYPFEVVAEAYAEWRNNTQPREIACFIGNLIEKKYHERFGV